MKLSGLLAPAGTNCSALTKIVSVLVFISVLTISPPFIIRVALPSVVQFILLALNWEKELNEQKEIIMINKKLRNLRVMLKNF